MKTAICVFLLSAYAFAQTADVSASPSSAIETEGFSNGRRWNRLEVKDRLFYIIAYHDGLVAGAFFSGSGTRQEKISRVEDLYPAKMTYTEIGVALDTFFEVPENALIPLPAAFQFIAMKASGAEPQKLDQFVATARRVAAASFARGK